MGSGPAGFQATASLPIYFRRVFSGPFLEPGLIGRSTPTTTDADCDTTCVTTTNNGWAGIEMLLGYHWTFDDGLNFSWAFGLAKHLTDDSSADFNGYLRVGYAF